jgi:hypothetical protein
MNHETHGLKLDLGTRRGMLAFARLNLRHARMELELAREYGFAGLVPELEARRDLLASDVAKRERLLAGGLRDSAL